MEAASHTGEAVISNSTAPRPASCNLPWTNWRVEQAKTHKTTAFSSSLPAHASSALPLCLQRTLAGADYCVLAAALCRCGCGAVGLLRQKRLGFVILPPRVGGPGRDRRTKAGAFWRLKSVLCNGFSLRFHRWLRTWVFTRAAPADHGWPRALPEENFRGSYGDYNFWFAWSVCFGGFASIILHFRFCASLFALLLLSFCFSFILIKSTDNVAWRWLSLGLRFFGACQKRTVIENFSGS